MGWGIRGRSSLNRHFSKAACYLLFPYLSGFSFLCHFSFAGFLWVKDKTDAAMHPARPRSETVTQFPQSLSFFLSFLPTIFFTTFSLSNHFLIRQSEAFLGASLMGSVGCGVLDWINPLIPWDPASLVFPLSTRSVKLLLRLSSTTLYDITNQ